MKATIPVRLDPADQETLAKVAHRLGWSPSKILSEGLRILDATTSRRRIIGLGKFASGVRDLGSNKKRLKRFGR
ncbi:MAG TPA: hypothetical protein VLX58_11025 [Bryobacteraceae bacterium]|nr:hypothetical protein [Bryobacteraceae bacterium]